MCMLLMLMPGYEDDGGSSRKIGRYLYLRRMRM